jgi:hypothetical protein
MVINPGTSIGGFWVPDKCTDARNSEQPNYLTAAGAGRGSDNGGVAGFASGAVRPDGCYPSC